MGVSTIVVGAHAIAYINGRPWANVRRFKFRVNAPVKEQMGLDSQFPAELIPTSYRVSGSMELYRQHSDGGLETQGAMPGGNDLYLQKYCTFSLVDRATNEILFRTDQMLFTSQEWDVPAGGVMTGHAEFVAINCRTSMDT